MLERDINFNDVIDRIEGLEERVEDMRDLARPTEVVICENPEWQALAGWVSTGSVLRSIDGEIILDPAIPMIQVGTGGYIQSEDFVTGVSGFQINGGVAEFNDVVIRGTIYATLGAIGGWVIGTHTLSADSGAVGLNSEETGGTDWRIWAGHVTPGSAPFRVDEDGNLVASSATITGTINATLGAIGGWVIGTHTLTADSGAVGLNSEETGGTDWRIWAGHVTPGSAPFRVDEDGNLVAASASVTGFIDANTGHLGDLDVDGVITVGLGAPYIEIDGVNKWIKSSNYASGISGLLIEADGDAEFNDVRIRGSLTSTVFVRDLIDARAGSLLIVKSGGALDSDMVVPGAGTWAMTIEDPPGGGFLFENSDICRCKTEYSGGIGDIWFVVSARADNGDGTQDYTCTYSSGTRSITYPAGAPVLDYGVSGDGGLFLTADDTNGPFLDVFTHAGAPWSTLTEHVRLGNLNGVGDYVSDAYGLFAGDYAGNRWMSYDPTNSLRIRGDAIIDGTVQATALTNAIGALLFSQADGSLLLNSHSEISETEWVSTRRQIATITGAFHCVTGPWPDTRALIIENGITNLIVDPVLGEDAASWAANDGATISWSDEQSKYGGYSLKVISGGNAYAGGRYEPDTAIDASSDYTASMWAYCSVAGIPMILRTTCDDSGNHSTAFTSEIGWKRYSISFTSSAGDTMAEKTSIFHNNDTTAHTFYLDAVQLEKTVVATSFCYGGLDWCAWTGDTDNSTSTRTATQVNLDAHAGLLSDNAIWSLSIWWQPQYDADADWPSANTYLFDTSDGGNNNRVGIVFAHSTDRYSVYINGAWRYSSSAQTFEAGDWQHVALTLDFMNDEYNILVNGVAGGNDTTSLTAPTGLDQMNLGTNYAASAHANAAFAEFALFDRELTANEAAAIYTLGKKMTDMGSFDTPGIYLLDGRFRLASSTSGVRAELTAPGLGVYNGTGLDGIGRVLVGRVTDADSASAADQVLDIDGADLGVFGYDSNDVLQVGWYASGANAGKFIAGGGNVTLDEDGIWLLAPASLVRASYVQWETSGAAFRARVGADSAGTLFVQALTDIDIGLYDGASTETQLIYISSSFIALGTDLNVDGMVRQAATWHAYGGYEDQAYTLSCAAATWTFITNATNTLWTGLESDGITMVDDQMVIANDGDYTGVVTLTVSALNGKDFHLRIYNITQSRAEGYPLGISTTGAGNEMAISIPIYIEATAGDVLEMQIYSTDGTDPILDDALFYVSYLHD